MGELGRTHRCGPKEKSRPGWVRGKGGSRAERTERSRGAARRGRRGWQGARAVSWGACCGRERSWRGEITGWGAEWALLGPAREREGTRGRAGSEERKVSHWVGLGCWAGLSPDEVFYFLFSFSFPISNQTNTIWIQVWIWIQTTLNQIKLCASVNAQTR